MSIFRAMQSGASGLAAETGALGVVGDNIANTSTVGFKQSRAVFADVLGAAVGGKGAGAGVQMVRTQQLFGQGAITNTGESTDVALSGDGFLVLKGKVAGVDGQFYSRAGQLNLSADGTLVSAGGMPVQGFRAQPDGTYGTQPSDLVLSTAPIPPKQTDRVTMTVNLDAAAVPPTAPFDVASPGTTSNLSTSITVFDSLGTAHVVDVHFRKNGAGDWEYHVLASGADLAGGTPGTAQEIGGGTLQFGPNGELIDHVPNGGTVDFIGAAPGQALSFDFGTPTAAGGTGLTGATQFGAAGAVSAQSQDGYASGALAGVKIDENGVVSGVYTNGKTLAAGKLAIAKFASNDGLARAGSNMWASTVDSGEAVIGEVGSGGRAALVAGALEQSNVDITQQFIALISHQRSFQANSKTITTADTLLGELMQLKR